MNFSTHFQPLASPVPPTIADDTGP